MEAKTDSERVNAVTETPNGAEYKLIYDPMEDSERVDVHRNGSVVTIASCPAGSFRATQIYNQSIEPFVDENGNELHD
jgi:fructose-1,6-bisphosphatase